MADTPATPTPPRATKTAAKKPAAKKPAARKPAAKPKTAATPRKAAPKKSASAAARTQARQKFNRAIEEARAGAKVLGQDAQARAGQYRAKLADSSAEWLGEAREIGGQAKDRAAVLAAEGKTRASDAISSLGKLVHDSAGTIDDKLGARYGDYARSAARTMQEGAARLDSKDFGELGEDAKEFVRKSPGLAVGLAAVAGFFLSRLFRGGSDD